MSIAENIAAIKQRIAAAAERSGRNADDVLLVAVTKTRSPEEIAEAIGCGCTDIGENKVQELTAKYDIVGNNAKKAGDIPNIKWHMIGHLQRNKVKYVIDKVCLIHSVDSLDLAREIGKRAAASGICADILLQVNAVGEESKFGFSPEEIEEVADETVRDIEAIRLRGLMNIAPICDSQGDLRDNFKIVKESFETLKSRYTRNNERFDVLSMGMTEDYETAIEEGSTLVRVGTGIFGSRNYQ